MEWRNRHHNGGPHKKPPQHGSPTMAPVTTSPSLTNINPFRPLYSEAVVALIKMTLLTSMKELVAASRLTWA
jgi:hypothetical protein